MARRYQNIWEQLKAAKVTNTLRVEVSGFQSYIKRDIKTIVRGVQKEKYHDFAFQVKNQGATLTHTVVDMPTVLGDSDQRLSVFVEFTLTILPTEDDFK